MRLEHKAEPELVADLNKKEKKAKEGSQTIIPEKNSMG
jgi:hypothetical protein